MFPSQNKKARKAFNIIENFIIQANKTCRYNRKDELDFDVYSFFGGYRLTVSKTAVSRVYNLIIESETVLTVEKNLMGEVVIPHNNISLDALKKHLSIHYLAATEATDKRLLSLEVCHEQL